MKHHKKNFFFFVRSFFAFQISNSIDNQQKKINYFRLVFTDQFHSPFSYLITLGFLLAKRANQLFRDEYLHVFIKSTCQIFNDIYRSNFSTIVFKKSSRHDLFLRIRCLGKERTGEVALLIFLVVAPVENLMNDAVHFSAVN